MEAAILAGMLILLASVRCSYACYLFLRVLFVFDPDVRKELEFCCTVRCAVLNMYVIAETTQRVLSSFLDEGVSYSYTA